jgi:putative ABC transport system permease protein
VAGSSDRPISGGRSIHYRSVTPGYFALLHVPLSGRDFTVQDGPDRPRVAIINRAAVAAFFGGQNPIGRRFMTSMTDTSSVTIVGVAGDVRFYGPASTPEPELFAPQAQNVWSEYTVLLSGRGAPAELLAKARGVLRAIDPNLPLGDAKSMDVFAAGFSARQRYYARVFGCFAAAAVLLSGVGIFGLIAYAAAQRRREIAIRMTLGARAGDIARHFIGNAAVLVLLGVAIGSLGAVAVGRTIASLLFGVAPGDVGTLAVAAGLLGVVGIAASIGPTVRAVRASPLEALR